MSLHYWGDNVVRGIGNEIRKFIDKYESKYGIQECTQICVNVDLRKGLPKVVKLEVDN